MFKKCRNIRGRELGEQDRAIVAWHSVGACDHCGGNRTTHHSRRDRRAAHASRALGWSDRNRMDDIRLVAIKSSGHAA